MKVMRKVGDTIFIDKRKFYTFKLPDGRVAETKSMTKKEARAYVAKSLGLTQKQVA